jgi:integrase
LEFVATCTTVRLFPDIVPDQFGHAGGNASKWYGRWLRGAVKITDARKVAHSWRHTWKDLARAQEISKDVRDAIQGHDEGNTAGDYGEGFPLEVLDRAMKKIPVQG